MTSSNQHPLQRLIISALALCLPCYLSAQSFQFTGSPQYQSLLGENFEINQIDITPLYTNDTAYITYRLIENTCPAGWEFILCDWSACFDDMPNTDDMDPLPPGYNALVKITANAHAIEGAGFLEFWIFPTGQMDLHESIFFYYNTASAVNELTASMIFHPGVDQIYLYFPTSLQWTIHDMQGKLVLSGLSLPQRSIIDTHTLANGVYLLKMNDGTTLKFVVAE